MIGVALRKGLKKRGRADSIDALVGSCLRALREQHELSQETLGERVDVSFQQIQKYERGANRVSASRLHQFAAVFGVPVQAFFDGMPAYQTDPSAMDDTASLEAFMRSREGRELFVAFDAISDNRARREVLQLIRVLASGS